MDPGDHTLLRHWERTVHVARSIRETSDLLAEAWRHSLAALHLTCSSFVDATHFGAFIHELTSIGRSTRIVRILKLATELF